MGENNKVLEKILSKIRYKNIVISISHSNYKEELGGTEKVICEEQEILFKNGISYIHFFPKTNGFNGPINATIQYLGITIDGEFIDHFKVSQLKAILYILEKLNVRFLAINIHHTLGIKIETLEKLIDSLNVNIKFFLHDYYSACPQINFLKNNQTYCGNMSENETKCLDCIYGERRKKLLNEFDHFFHKYDIEFIAPSQTAKEIWSQTFGDFAKKVRVIPHQVLRGSYRKTDIAKDKIKIAYVGYQSINKGWSTWKLISEGVNIDNYELYHLGAYSEKLKNVNHIKVSFHEDGRDAMIRKIRENNIDIVFLWSIWPETYSYTYFESYAAGAFVITNSYSGNISDQVIKNNNGIVLENTEDVYCFLSDKDNVLKLLQENTKREFPLILYTNTELLDEMKNLVDGKKEEFNFNKYDLINILNEI